MAIYQEADYVHQTTHGAFDAVYGPGQTVPHSGIYRCRGCEREIAANEGDPLPPQNRHQHTLLHGDIEWKLLVYAQN